MAKGKSQPVDAHVGRRVKERRLSLKMSQKKLAEAMNLSLRQVQKYEEGIDRLGASRLFDISRVLEVPISYFFQDLSEGQSNGQDTQEMSAPETKDLVKAYYRIADPKVRRYVYLLTKTLGRDDHNGQQDLQ